MMKSNAKAAATATRCAPKAHQRNQRFSFHEFGVMKIPNNPMG